MVFFFTIIMLITMKIVKHSTNHKLVFCYTILLSQHLWIFIRCQVFLRLCRKVLNCQNIPEAHFEPSMIMRTIHHKPKAYFEPYMIMRTVHHTLIYASLILSVLITVNGQCSGSVQNLSVGYSTISVSPPGYPTGYTT